MSKVSITVQEECIDWGTRPWGRPIVSCVSREYFAETGIAAVLGFRYYGMKVRGWRLVIRGGFATLVPPHVLVHLGGKDGVHQTAAYFLDPEQDKQFKQDVARVLDFMSEYGSIPGWSAGMKIT